jgi:TadE-like protein
MRSLIKSLVQLARCSSGGALVESTLILPIAISLMFGGVDFGWGFTTWATGQKSVRDAARYLGNLPGALVGTGTPPTWSGDCPGWAKTNAKNLAVYGNIAGTGSALVTGWQVSGGSNNNVSVDCSTPAIVVSAKFPYSPLFLAGFMPLGSTVTLSAQHTERAVNFCATPGAPVGSCL